MNEKKMARICWNTNNWIKPSGYSGKSTNIDTYECNFGFGHEEWLFDLDKIIDGYHYGYLTPIKKSWDLYKDKIFDILLYTRDGKAQNWYLVKWLNNVKVISPDECENVRNEYKNRGWFELMKNDLISVNANVNELVSHGNCFNIKFKPKDCLSGNNGLKGFDDIPNKRYMLLNHDQKYVI